MSDISQGQETGTGFESDNGGQGDSQPQGGSNPFLESVDPAHRQFVEPYIQKWDADVTRRFQELHSQYEPYKQLGDPEELAVANAIYQRLNEDPQGFYKDLAELLQQETGEQGSPSGQGQQQNLGQALPFQGLPEEFQAEYGQTRQAVEAMAQYILDQQQTQQAQQEDAELEQYMGNLKQQFGEFDEDFVLSKMYTAGMNGEQAVQAYHQRLQEFVNQSGGIQRQQTPKVLSGGGSVPQQTQKVSDLNRKDTKDLVAAIMQQASQE